MVVLFMRALLWHLRHDFGSLVRLIQDIFLSLDGICITQREENTFYGKGTADPLREDISLMSL